MQLGTITYDNQVAGPEDLRHKFQALRSVGVDGVMVDCWWGLVEGKHPQEYNWSGYHHLFNIVRETGLKLQVNHMLSQMSPHLYVIKRITS